MSDGVQVLAELQKLQQSQPDSAKEALMGVVKPWARTRLAHEAMMLDKIQRQGRIVETLARNTMTGKVEDTDGWPGHEGDDDMGVKIGDEVHNHYHAAESQLGPLPAPQPQPAPAEPSTESEPAWKTWLKRAALVGLPALAGAGGVAGYNALTVPEEKPPAVEQPAYTDSYMEYGVEVLPPSE